MSFTFRKNFVKMNNKEFSADFCFIKGDKALINSEKSNKPLDIRINEKIIATTLKISSYENLILFLQEINLIQEKTEIPNWFEELNFFDDLNQKNIIKTQKKRKFLNPIRLLMNQRQF